MCLYQRAYRIDAQQMKETCAEKAVAIFLYRVHYVPCEEIIFITKEWFGMLKQAHTWKLISLYQIDVSDNVLQAFLYSGGLSMIGQSKLVGYKTSQKGHSYPISDMSHLNVHVTKNR
jgi:hypothetical protein